MERIAYLGMGVMGRGMATNLLKAGHPVVVWNRNPERCKPLEEQGATVAATPAAAVAEADIVMYCLSDDSAVEELIFGADGVLGAVRSGQLVIDHTTVHPATTRRVAAAFAEREVAFLDAPVFGSKNESANAGLWIVVGGDRATYERAEPILERISETRHYMGGTAMGSSMKLVGNLVVASQLHALGEALLLATKAGLDPMDVIGVLDVTDFKSPILSNVGRSVAQRDFSPFFALRLMLKDANLIARFAQDLNVPTPASAAIRETIKAAVNQGHGEENASALIKALETMAGATIEGK